MEIKTLAGYGEISKDSYVTPFLNNSGCIVLIVNSGTNTKTAHKDALGFERCSGFKMLCQPKVYEEFSRWLMDTVIRQIVIDDQPLPEDDLYDLSEKYGLPGLVAPWRESTITAIIG